MRIAAKTAFLGVVVLVCAVLVLRGSMPQVSSGTWAPTGNLTEPRQNAAAALLADGRILITGGDAGGSALVSADLFNTDGTISPAVPMSAARSKHVSVTLQDGRVLVAGGTVTGGGSTNAAEIYDPMANTWTSLAGGMIEARSGATAALLPDGRVAIAGGQNGSVVSSTIEIFDPSVNGFSFAGVLSSSRVQHAMVMLADGRVMIIGGFNGTIPVSSSDIFDPVAGSVALGPSLVVPRFGHSATTLLNGQVLVAGGNNGSPDPASMDLASAEIFNPSAGTFTLAASALATPREGQLAFLLPHNNHVLLTGGTSAGVPVASSELFSPWLGTFAGTGSLTTARSRAVGSTMQQDGLLLVAGGGDANATALASTELHGFPTVKTDLPDYAPGTVVTITGSGWQPGETVTLSLVESPLVDTHPTLTAVADANGNILNNQFSPDIHDVNIRFYLTATGQSSGSSAQTTFTDAINITSATLQISNSVSCSSSVSAFTQGDTPVACVTVTGTNGNGAPGSFFVVWFNPPTTAQRTTTEAVPSGNPPILITDSFATTGSTSTGTWTVQVCKNTTCGGGGNMLASATFTLNGATSTSVSLTAGTNPSTYGSSLTFRATVTAGSGTPAGNVSFFDGGTCAAPGASLAGPTALNGSGQASFTTSALSATAHTILACYAGNASFGASGGTVSQAVNGKTLTVTGITANSKVYDGNATATLNTSGATLVGVVSGDSITLGTAGATGTFIDKNVGTAKAVTISGLTISGANAANYTLTQPAATADIKTAPLTATLTAADKPYDGTNAEPNASMSCSVATVIAGETVNCTASSGTFNTKDVSTANQVTATVTISGGSAGNYTLGASGTSMSSTSASGASHITTLTLTASIIGNPTRPYNGGANATLTAANFSLAGLVSGETIGVTQTVGTYNSKDVVSASTVTASLAAGDFTAGGGTLLSNYVLPTTASGAGHITAVTLTASIISDPTRPYNGGANATLTVANFSLAGLVSGETIGVIQTVGTYNSKDVVSASTVTASLAAGDFTAGGGTLLSNYVLPTTANGAGHITAVTLTASIIGNPTRPYNGGTNATLTAANFSLAGLVSGETIGVTQTAGTYNSKDVVSASTVTASLAAGDFTAGGGTLLTNYVLPTSAGGAGHITAVPLTASIIGNPTRPYNGNTNVTLAAANFSLAGLVTGETITVTQTTGTYNSKDVVSANIVTTSLATGDFTAGGGTLLTNYVLPTTASGAGHITAITLTASIIGDPTRPYNGGTNATLTVANFSLAGLVTGESISVTQTTGAYNSKDVVAASTVTASLAAGDFTASGGTLLSNYVLPTSAGGAGHITAVPLTASIIGNPTRPYNGGTNATVTAANFSLAGLVSGETIGVTQTAGTYNSKDVVSASTVTASLAAGDFTAGGGTLLTNYVLPTSAGGAGHITAVPLTASIIGDPTRPYNGNTNVTLAAANFSLAGLVTGETITVTQTTGAYNSKDVVSANMVTTSLATGDFTAGGGTLLTNYVLPTTASGPGHITAVTLTASIIGDPTRPYNGNANAILTGANFFLAGLVAGESISVTQTAGTYNSKDVVSANMVTTSLATGDFTAGGGTLLTNYVLPTTASGTGHITAVTLTASIIGDPTRPYNGNTTATLTAANFSLAGLVPGDAISVTQTAGTYNSKDVVSANMVTTSLATGDFTAGGGTLLTNYVLPTTASGTGHITAVTLTASIIGDPTRPYNGNTTATLTAANFSLAGLVPGDAISVTQTAGTYNSKDVVTASTVTASLAAGDFTASGGTLQSNYVLPTTASGAGHITVVTLTASIIGDPTRPYNGNTTATLTAANFSLAGLVAGDAISVTQTAGTYNSKDVANTTSVTASLATGDFTAGGGTLLTNYVLPTSASGAGHITAMTLTASIIGDPTRPYNGNTTATLTAANFSLAGLVGGDTIGITQTGGTYNSKDVATANTVTASLAAGDFMAGGSTIVSNYNLPTSASGPGHITAMTLTASIVGDPTRPYNGNTNAILTAANFSLAGLVAGDAIGVTQTVGTYNSKDVATANIVTTTLAPGDFTPSGSTMVGNYNLPTSASGPGHIGKTSATIEVTPYSLNYDGGAHTAAGNAKGALNESLSGLDVSGTTHTNAGDYPNDPWTFADVTGNYNNDGGTVHDHINKATPTVAVSFAASPITYDGNGHAASATATGVSGTLAIPANGTVTISYKKNAIVFAGTPTDAASYSASAHFASSNSNYNDADSTADASLTINKASTGTTVTSTPNPSTVGQSITFKAVVSNTQTSPVPTGSVQFNVDNSNFGAPVPLSGGMASVSTSSLSAGNHVVVATYLPSSDGNFNNSSGALSGGQNVQYSFIGFFAPIDNLPILNSVKAGQTIPVKWQLKDVNGNLISDLSSLAANGLVSGPIACNATDLTLPVEETLTSPGATVFRFDGTQFIYNWQTLKSYTGCRLLQVTLSDGTQHFAKFQFK